MDNSFIEKFIEKSSFGFALHKMILDKYGKPIDYEFIEVNKEFEKLIERKSKDIINKKVAEVLPGIFEDSFDWITYYGNIALKNQI